MTTDDQTQLDRIEQKLDDILKQVTPTEIVTDFEISTGSPRRRWWQRRPKPDFDLEATMRELKEKGLL